MLQRAKSLPSGQGAFSLQRDVSTSLRKDFHVLDRARRVSAVLRSRVFRGELETLIQSQATEGPVKQREAFRKIGDVAADSANQKTSPMNSRVTSISRTSIPRASSVIPVADLRGAAVTKYSKAERIARNKLASLYRLIDLCGWSDGIYGHSSVRVPHTSNEFLINPFGLLCHEITASSLVKVNIAGDIIDPGSTSLGINKAGYTLHSPIYSSRPDINCVLHVHTTAGAAVSCMKCGLLPITQDALSLGEVTYHPYSGIVVTDEEKLELSRDLGSKSKVMILNNHGLVAIGGTVDEAFYFLNLLVKACEFQVSALAVGLENIIVPNVDAERFVVGVDVSGRGMTWAVGELEWEAEMRKLDMQGYRTGQIYRTSSLIHSPSITNKQSDVAIPPVTTLRKSTPRSHDSLHATTDSDEDMKPRGRDRRRGKEKRQQTVEKVWDFLDRPASPTATRGSETEFQQPAASDPWNFLEEPSHIPRKSSSQPHASRPVSSQSTQLLTSRIHPSVSNEFLRPSSAPLISSTPIGQMAASMAHSTSQAARLTASRLDYSSRPVVTSPERKFHVNEWFRDKTPFGGSSSGVSLSPDDEEPHYGPLIHRSAMNAARTVDQLSASAMGELYNPMSVEFVKHSAQRVAQSTDAVAAQLTSAVLPLSDYN